MLLDLPQLRIDADRDGLAIFRRRGDIGIAFATDIPQLVSELQARAVTTSDGSVWRLRSDEGGARHFFLPPYSPDPNPIEQVFAKLKTLLRKADERSSEATWRRIGTLLDRFTPDECANYLRKI